MPLNFINVNRKKKKINLIKQIYISLLQRASDLNMAGILSRAQLTRV